MKCDACGEAADVLHDVGDGLDVCDECVEAFGGVSPSATTAPVITATVDGLVSRRPGRPRGESTIAVLLRLRPGDPAKIDAYAEANGLGDRSKAMRHYIGLLPDE